MQLRFHVRPELDKVVAVAQEANVAICDMAFLLDPQAHLLEALTIQVEGSEEASQYFSWLIEKSNLQVEKAA